MKIPSVRLINGVVWMPEAAVVVMNVIFLVPVIHTFQPDTSLEHTMQQKKSTAHSSQNTETTDM